MVVRIGVVKTSPRKCVNFIWKRFVKLENGHYKHKEFLDIEADIINNSLLYKNNKTEVIIYFKGQVLAMLFNKELIIWLKFQRYTETQKRAIIRTIKFLEKELRI